MRVLPVAGLLFLQAIFAAPKAWSQTYEPMLAPWGVYSAVSYCVNQQGQKVPLCPVLIHTRAYIGTNAHFHYGGSHPVSTFGCNPQTAAINQCQWVFHNGYWKISAVSRPAPDSDVPLVLGTTLVGQAETLITEAGQLGFWNDYAVGYTDLLYVDWEEKLCRIGGSDTGGQPFHGPSFYNRYMTFNSADGLFKATNDYINSHPGVTRLCANDMALPFGGKFDIYANWTNPHSEHDRGGSVDVAGPGSGQCNQTNCPGASQVNVSDFLNDCLANGAVANSSYNEGNHAHCSWINKNSYPR